MAQQQQRPITPERDLFILRSLHADILAGTHPLYRLPAHALMAASAGTSTGPSHVAVGTGTASSSSSTAVPSSSSLSAIAGPHNVQSQYFVPVSSAHPQQQQHYQQQQHQQQQVAFHHVMPSVPGPIQAHHYGDLDAPPPSHHHHHPQQQAQNGLPYSIVASPQPHQPVAAMMVPAQGFPPSLAGGHVHPQQQQQYAAAPMQYHIDPRPPPQSYT